MSNTGYKYPGTATSSGSPAWINPDNLESSGSATTCTLTEVQESADIVAYNFGFSIPSNAEIDGIKVIVVKSKDNNYEIRDETVKLRKAGVAVGDNGADGGNWVNGGSSYTTYGGSEEDLWGTTWTYSDINNTNFGVQLSAKRYDESGDTGIEISDLQVMVYYTLLYAPTVTTQAATSVTSKSATINGNITDIGTSSVTQHGFCIKAGSDPVNIAGADSYSELGAGSAGAFDEALTGLDKTTTYYYRPYATNSYDITYGSAVSFTTETYVPGAVDIESVPSVTDDGTFMRIRSAAIGVNSTTSLSYCCVLIKQGDVSIDTTNSLAAESMRIRQGAISISSCVSIWALWQVPGVCAISSVPLITASGTHNAAGSVAISIVPSVVADGTWSFYGYANISAIPSVIAQESKILNGTVTIIASSAAEMNQTAYMLQNMGYTGTLTAGDVLVIDCDEQTVKLNGSNATRYFSGEFPLLFAGLNELVWEDDDGLWSCDASSDTIYKHSGGTSAIADSFASPAGGPRGLTWDGTNLWSCDSNTDTIYKHSGGTSAIADSFASPGTSVSGLTWRGKSLWSCDASTGMIYKHVLGTSAIDESFASPDGTPNGLAYDGTNLWSCDSATNMIYKHVGKTSTIADSFASPGPNISGLAWDGTNLWSCDAATDMIYKHSGGTSTITESFSSPSSLPRGLTYTLVDISFKTDHKPRYL